MWWWLLQYTRTARMYCLSFRVRSLSADITDCTQKPLIVIAIIIVFAFIFMLKAVFYFSSLHFISGSFIPVMLVHTRTPLLCHANPVRQLMDKLVSWHVLIVRKELTVRILRKFPRCNTLYWVYNWSFFSRKSLSSNLIIYPIAKLLPNTESTWSGPM